MLQIMNAALQQQGFDEQLSENDGTAEFRLLAAKWPLIVEAELENGLYNFTRKQVFLQTRIAGQFGYEDAFLIPSDVLHVRRCWYMDGDQRIEPSWLQDGTHVHVDRPDGVFIEYVDAADPYLWSANFSAGVSLALEAVLLGFKEEWGAASQKEQEAGMKFQSARTNSSKGRSPRRAYRDSPIVKARFRRG